MVAISSLHHHLFQEDVIMNFNVCHFLVWPDDPSCNYRQTQILLKGLIYLIWLWMIRKCLKTKQTWMTRPKFNAWGAVLSIHCIFYTHAASSAIIQLSRLVRWRECSQFLNTGIFPISTMELALDPGSGLHKDWLQGETASLALSKGKKNMSTFASKAH